MAVGDVFKKRRNLVQSAAPLPTGAPQYSYRPQYGGWMQDNPVFNEPPDMRGMSESQMAGPLQEYLAQTGFLPNMVYRKNPMSTGVQPKPQYGGRVNAFRVEPNGEPTANFRVDVGNKPLVSNPMRPQDAIVNVQDGEDPDPNGYSLIPPSMTGTYKQNQPVYFQGVDPQTGQVSRVPISHKQMSAFNNPFLGSGDMGRPEDGSIAPVAGGPRSFNPIKGQQVQQSTARPFQGMQFPGLRELYGESPAGQQVQQSTVPTNRVGNRPLVSNSMVPYRGPSALDMLDDRSAAAQIRGSAAAIDSLREQSQVRFPSNPMSPTFGVVNPDVESARRLAPLLAQDAARQQNTPMNGNTAYANNPMRYRPDDPAMQARQQDNAQRMTAGRLVDRTRGEGDRFAGSAGRINAEYDKVQAGQGIFNNGQFLDFTPTGSPQWGTAENMRRRTELGNAPQQATQEQRDSAQARRAGIQREFIDRTGMNYAQARRAERKDDLRQRSFNKAVIKGMNPFGPEAQAMFPQQVAAAKAGATGQPVAGQNPMGGGSRTLEAQQAAATRIQERETTSPNVAGLGVEPGAGLAGLNQVLSGRLQEDPNAEFSDESLREFQAHAKDYGSLATDTNNPFDFGEGLTGQGLVGKFQADMWKELATLPDNARARAEWLARYKTEPANKAANPEFQQPSPMQTPGRPMYRGGNPVYNPMRPIRTGA